MSYQQALSRALIKVNEDKVASSWKDSLISGRFTGSISEYLTVPKKNCFIDRRKKAIIDREYTINKIWSLEVTLDGIMVTGFGELGIYRQNVWGVGSRRGRTKHEIHSGDVLDFGVFYMQRRRQTSSIRRNETT
jgi:hypothetical protein